jgi:hypothetical protein
MSYRLKLLAASALALSLVQPAAYSMEKFGDKQSSSSAKVFEKNFGFAENQENLDEVMSKVEAFMKDSHTPIQAHDITVVFDVDGTLTDHSLPGQHQVKSRYNAVNIVKELIDLQVNVVISSAWNNFAETKDRLNALGLGDVLGLTDENPLEEGVYTKIKRKNFEYIRQGKVASVREVGTGKFYRQKALAPYVLGTEGNTKKVIFVDDSEGNIDIFTQDIVKYNLYPNVDEVFSVGLTVIAGIKPKRKDNPLAKAQNTQRAARKDIPLMAPKKDAPKENFLKSQAMQPLRSKVKALGEKEVVKPVAKVVREESEVFMPRKQKFFHKPIEEVSARQNIKETLMTQVMTPLKIEANKENQGGTSQNILNQGLVSQVSQSPRLYPDVKKLINQFDSESSEKKEIAKWKNISNGKIDIRKIKAKFENQN